MPKWSLTLRISRGRRQVTYPMRAQVLRSVEPVQLYKAHAQEASPAPRNPVHTQVCESQFQLTLTLIFWLQADRDRARDAHLTAPGSLPPGCPSQGPQAALEVSCPGLPLLALALPGLITVWPTSLLLTDNLDVYPTPRGCTHIQGVAAACGFCPSRPDLVHSPLVHHLVGCSPLSSP